MSALRRTHNTRVLTARGAFRAVGWTAREEGIDVLLCAGEVGGTEGAPDAVDVTVELNVAHVLRPDLRLALTRGLDLLARGSNQPCSLLKTIDVLGV